MTPESLITTSILLGMFSVWAGGYGILYALGNLTRKSRYIYVSFAVYGLQLLTTFVIIMMTPLGAEWKFLISGSALVCGGIPPVTWRFLERLHSEKGAR